jgi:glycosyltransferase involved in cell wall biosynthesis
VSDYYIYIGGFTYRKGIATLIKAFVQLLNAGRDPQMILLGMSPAPNFKKFVEMAIDTGLVKYLPRAEDQELIDLIAGAKALIYPSVYEGFGLPIIEAMRCRCPVITSNVSSMPEVAGDAAIYFESENPNSLAQQIMAFEDGNIDIPALVERGWRRSLDFTWARASQQYIDLFQTLYNK